MNAPPDRISLGASRILPATEEELGTAARLKVLLGQTRRMVVVTGIDEKDGETVLAARLAIGLASIDSDPVLLIDGDVRKHALHQYLEAPSRPGLAQVLEGTAELNEAVHSTEQANLFFMPPGESVQGLSCLLNISGASATFEAIRRRFRWVLINGGVVTSTAEGILLSAACDGAVLGLAVGARRRHEVTEFAEVLARFGITLLGAVLVKKGK